MLGLRESSCNAHGRACSVPIPMSKRLAANELETPIMQEIQAFLASQSDVYIRRNNTGLAVTADGRRLVYGLGRGGPDLIGSVALPFFGRVLAQSIGVEVKSATGRTSADQLAWHAGATLLGWRVCVARSVADVQVFLADVRRGL